MKNEYVLYFYLQTASLYFVYVILMQIYQLTIKSNSKQLVSLSCSIHADLVYDFEWTMKPVAPNAVILSTL